MRTALLTSEMPVSGILVMLSGKKAQAFDADAVVSELQLQAAWKLAENAWKTKKNIAKSFGMEVLVRASGDKQVSRALQKLGVKTTKRFWLAWDGDDRILEKLNAKKIKPTKPNNAHLAKIYGVDEKMLDNYSLENLVLEKMALLDI